MTHRTLAWAAILSLPFVLCGGPALQADGEAPHCPVCGQEAKFENTPEGAFRKFRVAFLLRDEALLKECCANLDDASLRDLLERSTKDPSEVLSARLKSVEVDGDKATLHVVPEGGPDQPLPAIRDGGVWKLDLGGRRDQSMEMICLNSVRMFGSYMVMWCRKFGHDRTYPGPGVKFFQDLYCVPDEKAAIAADNLDILACDASTEKPTMELVRKGDPACSSYEVTDKVITDDMSREEPILWDKTPIHGGKRNVLFFSGSAKAMTEEEFQALRKKFAK